MLKLGGFAAGTRPVGSDIVLDVCRDFDLRVAPPPPRVAVRPEPEAGAVAARPVVVPTIVSPAPEQSTASPSEAGGGEMFGAFSARRKRFSFFWN